MKRRTWGFRYVRDIFCLWIRILISHFSQGIVTTMTTVSITDLKSNLAYYLREARRGEVIQVLDRGTPVARITPPKTGSGRLHSLIGSGLLRPGKGKASEILNEPPLAFPDGLSSALAKDRDDRL